MSNSVIVLSEELLKRVYLGLGELPSKVSHIVILEIEAQEKLADANVKAYIGLIEQHLQPFKDKLATAEAAVKAEAEKVAAKVEQVAAAVVEEVKAIV
jgi:hypothetical protein